MTFLSPANSVKSFNKATTESEVTEPILKLKNADEKFSQTLAFRCLLNKVNATEANDAHCRTTVNASYQPIT